MDMLLSLFLFMFAGVSLFVVTAAIALAFIQDHIAHHERTHHRHHGGRHETTADEE